MKEGSIYEVENTSYREALELLYDAVPKQTEDADWWPDELTRAMKTAEIVLSNKRPDQNNS